MLCIWRFVVGRLFGDMKQNILKRQVSESNRSGKGDCVRTFLGFIVASAVCVLRLVERLLIRVLCFSVRAYKRFVSPLQYALCITFGLQCECRFRPTCSEYALGCLEKYRLPTACLLIVKRLLRCQPWGCGGWDPVP